ncbi:right-handed parallel beta-helix repeat-containing protein [Zobellia galactanivorans]|uniref:T9SS type A sorting domain-containing protein n=1 Tax=Zobellia galactanivorans (strain DSM 12802 / CCUG 47099 / CIP 106680 / NCIMB 13871 / Dsij) TaxID=63186 RepID=UPI0026E27F1B|nr:T9SS type A sorting domain-containing protein [Zobellia galactanivorans]MDO6809418.1 right-handed parallel beta-helix repeat-containing protein [Zobellia galactanivorans]
MSTKQNYLFSFLFLFLISISSFARDIYVAKNGDDTNPGTLESPYLTISKAASEAVAGDIVYIRAGTYEETLTPANSGSPGQPIVFQSYPGEKVIISAMDALSGWTQDSGSIYKTTISFPSLGQENFVMNDATALDLARWPNKTDDDPFALGTIRNTGGSSGDVINGAYLTESTIPGIDWTGGALWFYGDKGGSGWLAWKRKITGSSAGRVNFNHTTTNNETWVRTFHAPADLGDFYLEGVKDALDYQNEWYFDESTSTLYVQLPGGNAPVDGKVKMRRRLETINLKDKKYIEIRNLAVFGGSINMEDSSTWWASNANSKTTNNLLYGVTSFYGNHTQGITDSSRTNNANVHVQGSNNRIEKCEIAFNAGAGLVVRGNNQQIIDNYIHDCNFLGSYDGPLVIRGIKNSLVKNNTVFRGGRDAVQYNGSDNEFSYNDISRSNLIADDCALFYTVGAQYTTEIHHNWFHDTASGGTKYKAAGIYLDNNAAGFVVHHNVVWNTEWTSVQINWNGTDIDIFNNTLWNGSAVMGAWHKDGTAFSNVRVWNNLGSDTNWEPQSDKQNNLTVTSGVFVNAANGDFNLKSGASPIDQGKVIPGITDGFTGDHPDVGAYENGGEQWIAGITWQPLYGAAGLGCYGLPGEDCIAFDPNDDDNDGVANADDECPETPLGSTVNTKGCKIFSLAADNFRVKGTDESCSSSNDGTISIHSKDSSLQFKGKIKETGAEKDFTSDALFEQLGAGDYTLCVTTPSDANFEQCFVISIDEPEDLSVTSKVDNSTNQLTLSLKGATNYSIDLNGVVTHTTEDEITLDLSKGQNKLSVKADKLCQGEYSEIISVFDGVTVFPNKVKDQLNVAFSHKLDSLVTLELISATGKVILSKTESVGNQMTTIDTSNLSSGIYFLNITATNIKSQAKIIKQ